MSHALLGVAHRTLPCGTPVSVFFGGKAITVPVIDRGPFANGARYDLTSATAQVVGHDRDEHDRRRAPARRPCSPAPAVASGTGALRPLRGRCGTRVALLREGAVAGAPL